MIETTAHQKKQKQIGDYILGSNLGTGGFAKVVQGIHVYTGEKVAIKILNMEKLKKDDKENIKKVKKEIEILKLVKHKNIIKLYDVINTTKKIYLIMELCEGGELFDQIDSKHNLTELEALKYFQEYIDAIDYLHSQKIVHRDLKPENMLIDNNQSIKLIDFGISSKYTSFLSTPCGTTSYASPEMHEGAKYSGMLSDVWSGGIVLYTMVCGYLPFFDDDEDCHVRNILRGKFKIPSAINPLLQDLIYHCLRVNPMERYNINQIKKHPWFNIVTPILRPGIIMGIHAVPIDETLIDIVKTYISNKEEIRKNVLNNQYNSITALYYIILKKKQREEGYSSISDLVSDKYLNFIDNQYKTIFYQINSIEDDYNSSQSSGINTLLALNYSKAVVESQSQQCNNTPSTSMLEHNSTTPNKEINDNKYINDCKKKENDFTLTLQQKHNERKVIKKLINQTQERYKIVKLAQGNNYNQHHHRCLSENAKNYSISPVKNNHIPNKKIQFEKISANHRKLSTIVFNEKDILLQQKKKNIFNNNRKLKRRPIQLLSHRISQAIITNNSNSNRKRTNSFDSSQQQKMIIGLNRSLVLEANAIPKTKRNHPTLSSSSMRKKQLNHSTILYNNLKQSNLSSNINITQPQPKPLNNNHKHKHKHNFNQKNNSIEKNKKDNKITISQQQINYNKSKYPKAYKGFVDLRCVSIDNIDNIMNKILTFFNSKQITYASVAPFKYHCSKYGEVFDLEVSSLLNKASVGRNRVYYISLLSKQGNITNQNGLINQLFPL